MSEDRPHIVYPKAFLEGEVYMAPTYKAAHDWWLKNSTYKFPYLIATIKVEREIDPSTPIIDVNE